MSEKKKIQNVNPAKGQKKSNNKKEECNFKEWKSVSQGCINIFQGKKLSNSDFVKMFETIRAISNTEVGLTYMVSNNYEEAILKRGMVILKDEIKEKPGHAFLVKLGEVWTSFYQNLLPTLQALFCSIPTHRLTVKQMTMLSFRDIVLLKVKVDEALSANESSVPKPVKQMFCVLLQAVHDNTENYFKLEALAARVINPLLGLKGLYIRSEVKEHHESKLDRFSAAPTHNYAPSEYSPELTAKSSTNNVDAEFEELMNLRRQKYNHYDGGPQRLSCVEEKSGEISESLASLLADGFEIG